MNDDLEPAANPPRWAPQQSDGAEPSPAAGAAGVAVVDRERLEALGLLDGDDDEESVADLFAESAAAIFEQMQAAITAGDAEALRIAGHALKGSALNLGADRLSPIAVELERRGREGPLDGAQRLLEQARVECARVLEALHDLEQAA